MPGLPLEPAAAVPADERELQISFSAFPMDSCLLRNDTCHMICLLLSQGETGLGRGKVFPSWSRREEGAQSGTGNNYFNQKSLPDHLVCEYFSASENNIHHHHKFLLCYD